MMPKVTIETAAPQLLNSPTVRPLLLEAPNSVAFSRLRTHGASPSSSATVSVSTPCS